MTSQIAGNAGRGVILVVDDEPDILIALQDLFEDEYRVLATTSPREGSLHAPHGNGYGGDPVGSANARDDRRRIPGPRP